MGAKLEDAEDIIEILQIFTIVWQFIEKILSFLLGCVFRRGPALRCYCQEKIDEAAEIYSEHFGDGDALQKLGSGHPQGHLKKHLRTLFASVC